MEEKKLKDFLPDRNSSYKRKFSNSNKLTKIKEEHVIDCIRSVMDPEIPVNIYELGLIYKIEVKDNKVIIEMTSENTTKTRIPNIFKVEGVSFCKTVVESLREGQILSLEKDPENKYDSNAIKIVTSSGEMV